MILRELHTAPVFKQSPKGVSKLYDFIENERHLFYLKGQKYVATHTEAQIEKAFCQSLINIINIKKGFDYDQLTWDSNMNVTFAKFPSDNYEKRKICPKNERLAIVCQKLQSFAFGMAEHSETIKNELRKHKKLK